jgi:hypothetical protein
MVPACEGNQPTISAPLDTLCQQAIDLCSATPEPVDLMFWIYSGPPGVSSPSPAQWTRTGQRCLRRDQVAAAAVPAFTARDFRRLPWPPGAVTVQPSTLRTLVNAPTNVFVRARIVTLDTTLLGLPVRVRATPARYDWAFGDGGVLSTSDPGGPYPDMTTTHTYAVPGEREVTLTTAYTGEYSVSGGPWLPIDGEASVASPPVGLTVVEARAVLVDRPLP